MLVPEENIRSLPGAAHSLDDRTSLSTNVSVFKGSDRHLSENDKSILLRHIHSELNTEDTKIAWDRYQSTIKGLVLRMGSEHGVTDSLTRVPFIRDLEGIRSRVEVLPFLSRAFIHTLSEPGKTEIPTRVVGEWSLMELSAAAGYRTFCIPELVLGLKLSGKMLNKPVRRMIDTFEFLRTMIHCSADDALTNNQIKITNEKHEKLRVAGRDGQAAKDLFKYIALNMFYIGPSMRPDLTPSEREALCGLTVLVAKRMGHSFNGSVVEFDQFIDHFEKEKFFDLNIESPLRDYAAAVALSSRKALERIPMVSSPRIEGYVPPAVKHILKLSLSI